MVGRVGRGIEAAPFTLLGSLGDKLAGLALAAGALHFDLVTGDGTGVGPLDGVAVHLASHGERYGVASDLAIVDGRFAALAGGHGAGELFAVGFQVEDLFPGFPIAARHLRGPLTRYIGGYE